MDDIYRDGPDSAIDAFVSRGSRARSEGAAEPVGYEPIESGSIQKGDKVFNGDGRWLEIPMLVGQPIRAGGYAVIRPIKPTTK